jgi:hypothetical protein
MNGQSRRVVLSYGMGADSTALLLRWILEPATRPCRLDQILVITAMTGDEWPVTGHLVAGHILPLLRAHGIRWVTGRTRRPRPGGRHHDPGRLPPPGQRVPRRCVPALR